MSDRPPTLAQMQELLNLAYQLGWRDGQANLGQQPPTMTILPNPDNSWTFLYDGKPRP